jgi:hypothetical protein
MEDGVHTTGENKDIDKAVDGLEGIIPITARQRPESANSQEY